MFFKRIIDFRFFTQY